MPKRKSQANRRAAKDTVIRNLFLCFGNPKQVMVDHEIFGKSVDLFRSKDVVERLRKQYTDKWIGVYDGEVVVHADTLDQLLTMMDERQVPRHTSYVKRMTREPISMIL